jgi:hypothetical protein
MTEMLNGDMARAQIEDRIRDGASARSRRHLSASRATERRAHLLRLVGVTVALLPSPFRH